MKNFLFLLLLALIYTSCSSPKNNDAFITKTTGRYLFNANEVLEIYYKEKELHVKWRSKNDIKPLKVNDSSFYMKEINEKIIFVSKPNVHIRLAEKKEHKGVQYQFKKMKFAEKTPSEYFKNKEFHNALLAYQKIQKKDSLNPVIKRNSLNSVGYSLLHKNEIENAIEIFKINTILYPKNSNVYDSLGEAYLKNKDTVNAIVNFKKSLSINPENSNSKRFLKKITKQ